jgi:RHS repeat-associated protein
MTEHATSWIGEAQETSKVRAPFIAPGEAATKAQALQVPALSLPKGGGALKGIDEKFQVNSANGTAGLSIPLPFSPGRGGFTPTLALSYSSGAGNGPFGLGWSVDAGGIQRKTDRQLPRYEDADGSDIFLLGGEDLVPQLHPDGTPEVYSGAGFRVARYRPRIEGAFAKIEQITPLAGGPFFWKVTSRANVATLFGRSAGCRLADPRDAGRVARWLPELSFDDQGHAMAYEYKAEGGVSGPWPLHERNRYSASGEPLFAQLYLKRICYGNRQPFFPAYGQNPADAASLYSPGLPAGTAFLFEAVFDFGEHSLSQPQPGEEAPWAVRADPFSDYRLGFEVRTHRQCRRVLLFHRFAELGAQPCLVRSLDLTYEAAGQQGEAPAEVSYLTALTQRSYVRQADGSYLSRALPPLELRYERLRWQHEVKDVAAASVVNAPGGLAAPYQWVDLFNEGIAGILAEQAAGWFYKSNLGNGQFTAARPVQPKPSWLGLATGALTLQDLEADGRRQVVSHSLGGYFELGDEGDWQPFQRFDQLPTQLLSDPNTRLLDLDGDGRPDLLVAEELAFRWYPSQGKHGYAASRLAPRSPDEERGPTLLLNEAQQSLFLADMSGDGLTDLVRIRNGELCYWPNLGYGRFGARVSMSQAPVFDSPEAFDPRYLHLADVSGTGATDLLYLGRSCCRAWLNHGGNAWSAAVELPTFPDMAWPNQLSVVDLLGQGTACLVWSSPLPAQAAAPLRFVDLMGGRKPHLLTSYVNNLGLETRLEYRSSTQYYLDDQQAGTPWLSKLPFPVQCVSRREVIDHITDLRFATRYSYHHGYYDHGEREFRGFGRVDQLDTEEYEYLKSAGAANASDPQFQEPPVLTKTWFHTGAYVRQGAILTGFSAEYWPTPWALPEAEVSAAAELPADALAQLSAADWQQLARACKGLALRQETYALDGSALAGRPFTVAGHSCHVRLVQARGANPYPVFLVTESQALSASYERQPDDARLSHSLNLAVDDLGNVQQAVSVVYPRSAAGLATLAADLPIAADRPFVRAAQAALHLSYSESRFTQDLRNGHPSYGDTVYRLRQPWASETYEVFDPALVEASQQPGFSIFRIEDFDPLQAGLGWTRLRYEQGFKPAGGRQLRLIEATESRFRADDLVGVLPAGSQGRLGLGHESYQLAFTPELVQRYFNEGETRVTPALLAEGQFTDLDGTGRFWIRSGLTYFFDPSLGETAATAASRFYQPTWYEDPLGTRTRVSYEPSYLLFAEKTTDVLGNEVVVERFNYRVLAAERLRDANLNHSEVAFDGFGLVAGGAVLGKDDGSEGDSLAGFRADLSAAEVEAFFADPLGLAPTLLGGATGRFVYDVDCYRAGRLGGQVVPTVAAGIVREKHLADLAPGESSPVQLSFEYSDGRGQVVLKKRRAEAGLAPFRDAGGQLVRQADGSLAEQAASPRWLGNGRSILNNKGQPVRQYEPYFSDSHHYDAEAELRETGVSPTRHYDAAGRLVRTVFPDGTFSRNEYDAWQQRQFEVADTVLDSPWYARRIGGGWAEQGRDPAEEQRAAEAAAVHANTPARVYTDSLGRPVYAVAHNRFTDFAGAAPGGVVEEFLASKTVLDVEGNIRAVVDPRGNTVMSFAYDMLGHRIYQASMDAGQRWALSDCAGQSRYGWDSRGQRFASRYDLLQRPTEQRVRFSDGSEVVLEKIEYGSNPALNQNGQVLRHYDGAGRSDLTYTFAGHLATSTRTFVADGTTAPNWQDPAAVAMQAQAYPTAMEYDALGRPIRLATPDGSVARPRFNEAGLLDGMGVSVRGGAEQAVVTNIDYDAKGQRQRIAYGNGSQTRYTYDRNTFQLLRLLTTRSSDSTVLQDWRYTYDAGGNITAVRDEAQQAQFFNNTLVEPQQQFWYDALARLIRAAGREHAGGQQPPNEHDLFRRGTPPPSDETALQSYRQRYEYDPAGNLLRMVHDAGRGAFAHRWTRSFDYAATSNRLLSTAVGGEVQAGSYDAHGSLLGLPHLSGLAWGAHDQLARVDKGGGGLVYYQYDGSGQRVRKVWRKPGGLIEERLYLGSVEVFTKENGGGLVLRRETLHLSDGGRDVALVETRTDGADDGPAQLLRYQYANHLGSASLELDPAAAIISYEEFHPFGATAWQSGRSTAEVNLKRYRYTGKERDEESGFYYHGARYYAPWLARWTAADPIGIGDGLNLYAYVSNNPIMLSDPGGTTGVYDEAAGVCRMEAPCSSPAETPAPAPATPITQPPAPAPAHARAASGSGGHSIPAPPPVSPTDYSLHVSSGAVYTQYQAAIREVENSDNAWYVRLGFGALATIASPMALAEEYIARPLVNTPHALLNAGTSGGEHLARAYLWSEQGETGEAVVETLTAVRDLSVGFVEGVGALAPLAAPLERELASATTRRTVASRATPVEAPPPASAPAVAAEPVMVGHPRVNTGTGTTPVTSTHNGVTATTLEPVGEWNCAFVTAAGASPAPLTSSRAAQIMGLPEGPLPTAQVGMLWEGLGLGSSTPLTFQSRAAALQHLRAMPAGTRFGLVYRTNTPGVAHALEGGVGRLGPYFRDNQTWAGRLSALFGLDRRATSVQIYLRTF